MGKGFHITDFRFVISLFKLCNETHCPTAVLITPAPAILAWSKLWKSVLITIGFGKDCRV